MRSYRGVPDLIRIGPHVYSVQVSELRSRDSDVRFGVTDVPHTEIVINPEQSDSQLRDTVLHETLHAILDVMGVSKGEALQLLDPAAEERLTATLSPLLLDVLRRNPELVAFLTEDPQ